MSWIVGAGMWKRRLDCTVEGLTTTGARFRFEFELDGEGARLEDFLPMLRKRTAEELTTGFIIERWSVEQR
jgi:hypothetical protein